MQPPLQLPHPSICPLSVSPAPPPASLSSMLRLVLLHSKCIRTAPPGRSQAVTSGCTDPKDMLPKPHWLWLLTRKRISCKAAVIKQGATQVRGQGQIALQLTEGSWGQGVRIPSCGTRGAHGEQGQRLKKSPREKKHCSALGATMRCCFNTRETFLPMELSCHSWTAPGVLMHESYKRQMRVVT